MFNDRLHQVRVGCVHQHQHRSDVVGFDVRKVNAFEVRDAFGGVATTLRGKAQLADGRKAFAASRGGNEDVDMHMDCTYLNLIRQ
jgi:hypothetical protein